MSTQFANPTNDSENYLTVAGVVDQRRLDTLLHMPDGRIVKIPTAVLVDGLESPGRATPQEHQGFPLAVAGEDLVIPVVEEQLSVDRRTVITGKVFLHRSVTEYEEALDEPLAVRTFDIERVALNQPVESAPAVRVEGDTTIYPLVEEQLVLTRRLILKEEVRVTKRDTERRDTRVVTLRREHLTVERALPETE